MHCRHALLACILAALLPACNPKQQVREDDPKWRVPMAATADPVVKDSGPELAPAAFGTDLLELEGLDAEGRRKLPGAVDDRAWAPPGGGGRVAGTASTPAEGEGEGEGEGEAVVGDDAAGAASSPAGAEDQTDLPDDEGRPAAPSDDEAESADDESSARAAGADPAPAGDEDGDSDAPAEE